MHKDFYAQAPLNRVFTFKFTSSCSLKKMNRYDVNQTFDYYKWGQYQDVN